MRHLFTAVAAVSALVLVTTAAQAKTKKTTTTTTTTTTTAPSTVPTTDSNPSMNETPADQPDVRPTSASEGSAFKVGFDGYADIQAKVSSHRDVGDRGFSLNDASLFMRAAYKNADAVVDLPFYTEADGAGSNGGQSNSFHFGTEQAQAFLNFHHFSSMPVYVRVGQYDSFFGLEDNHSRDRFFADKGLIKSMLPWTSTGALAGWTMGHMTLQAQVANGPTNGDGASQWTSSSGTMTENAPSYAANAKWEEGGKMASLSFMADHNGGTVQGSPDGYLVDGIISCRHDRMSMGVEGVYRKFPGTDGATNEDRRAGYDDSYGVAALGAWHFNDALSGGVRFEWAHDPVLLANNQTGDVFQGSIGPVWQLEKNLALRADATAGHIADGSAAIRAGMFYSFSASAVATLF